jgi:cytochrome P450
MDYQEIESILQVRHAEFDRGENTARVFRHLLPTGQISQITGPMWKHHRRIIGPAMTSKHLSLTTPRANEAVKNLIELFKLKADKAEGRSFVAEGDMESATMVCPFISVYRVEADDVGRHLRDGIRCVVGHPRWVPGADPVGRVGANWTTRRCCLQDDQTWDRRFHLASLRGMSTQ